MIYITNKIYKDRIIDIDLIFVKKKKINEKKSLWQPVRKIAPLIYVKQKSEFIDFAENFKLVKN